LSLRRPHEYSRHELIDGATLEKGEGLQVGGCLQETRLAGALVEDAQHEQLDHF